MQTIAIVNRRGGVGKTATAHALGAGLRKKGYKVLFIDLDSQTNVTSDAGAKAGALSAMDLLTGNAAIDQIIINTPQGDIVPASPALAGADLVINETGKEYRLKEALAPVNDIYDFAIIDTPPALGTITTNALTAASAAIIPAQAEIHSLQGIGLLNETITAVRKYTNPALVVDGILLTRYNGRAVISKDMRDNLESIAAALQTRLYKTPIRECVSIKEAQARQQDIFSYAPRSNAAKDYTALIDEFLQGRKEVKDNGKERI